MIFVYRFIPVTEPEVLPPYPGSPINKSPKHKFSDFEFNVYSTEKHPESTETSTISTDDPLYSPV